MNFFNVFNNIIKPKGLYIEKKTATKYYTEFCLDPLEKGYGTTLGNSLRRVLLSSIGGYSITSVKIENISNEFSFIPGVKDDSIDIFLNIKKISVLLKNVKKKAFL